MRRAENISDRLKRDVTAFRAENDFSYAVIAEETPEYLVIACSRECDDGALVVTCNAFRHGRKDFDMRGILYLYGGDELPSTGGMRMPFVIGVH